MKDMMDVFVGESIENVPLKSKRLLTKGDLSVFQAKNFEGELLPYYWVQKSDGEVIFFSEHLARCVEIAFAEG